MERLEPTDHFRERLKKTDHFRERLVKPKHKPLLKTPLSRQELDVLLYGVFQGKQLVPEQREDTPWSLSIGPVRTGAHLQRPTPLLDIVCDWLGLGRRTCLKIFLALVLLPLLGFGLMHLVAGPLTGTALALSTGFLGAVFVRKGARAYGVISDQLRQGLTPSDTQLNRIALLLSGLLLLLPDPFTDTAGLALLLPGVRTKFKKSLRRRITVWINRGLALANLFS